MTNMGHKYTYPTYNPTYDYPCRPSRSSMGSSFGFYITGLGMLRLVLRDEFLHYFNLGSCHFASRF